MSNRSVCPWWMGYLLASPLRRLAQSPGRILSPFLRTGMKVLEPGPGMGFFTLEMARIVGPTGHVVAVDIQPRMLEELRRRAQRAGFDNQIETRLAEDGTLGVSDLASTIDFVLAFAMVHEMPDAALFFREAAQALKPGGCMLLAEPRGHVKEDGFAAELTLAARVGLNPIERPQVPQSHAALLRKV